MTELDAPPPERMRAQFRKPEKESWRRTETAYTIQKWLEEAGQDGPYCIPFPSFLDVYNLISRMSGAADTPVCLLLCTLSGADGRSNPDAKEFHEAMERLEQTLVQSLRWEDVFTRYSRSQFLVILIGAQEENLGVISARIDKRFCSLAESGRLRLDCQMLPAGEMMLSGK